MMAGPIPNTPPPPHLALRTLPILLRRLSSCANKSTASSDSIDTSDRQLLSTTLRTIACLRLSRIPITASPVLTLPLSQAKSLNASSFDLPTLIDLILAYPEYSPEVSNILSPVFQVNPDLLDTIRVSFIPQLIERSRLDPNPSTSWIVGYTLSCLLRAHEELLGLILSEADFIIPALRDSYKAIENGTGLDKKSVESKGLILMICRDLEDSVGGVAKEGMRRLINGGNSNAGAQNGGNGTRGFMRGNTLGEDYLLWTREDVDDDVCQVLQAVRDDQAREDSRLMNVIPLFPNISPYLLSSALDHPSISTAEDPVSVLTDNILTGGDTLSADLMGLKMAIKRMSEEESSSFTPPAHKQNANQPNGDVNGGTQSTRTMERRNIFDDEELDFSRLRLRDQQDENDQTPIIGKAIPDHLRESILRLVETQKREAEEEARAVAYARGEVYVPEREGEGYDEEDIMDVEEGVGRLKVAGDGEDSDEEDENDVAENKVEKKQLPTATFDIDIQSKLELAYLADPRIFDRDATTRRSNARKKLKEDTGMDDGQLEGWRVMLERNPHKDAILARHTYVPKQPDRPKIPLSAAPSEVGSSNSGSRGGSRANSRGGRGNRGGSGRGGGNGGQRSEAGSGVGSNAGKSEGGSRSRGGGGQRGGGRGAPSKGSRGHSNAARTRGHDKKMAKMGTGL